jgi:hypothetical protein
MGLNNIQLPSFTIVQLYEHILIDANDKKEEPVVKTDPVILPVTDSTNDEWKYLGENKKNILIAVDYKDAVHLPDDELSFLTQMLAACKLGLGDVAILNRNNYQAGNYNEMKTYFKSRIILLFGIEPVSFGLAVNFPHFQIQSLDKATFLYAPSLEEIKKDELLKSKLWVCLRRIFVV